MQSVDMLRQVLQQQAITAVANNGHFPCRIGNEPFKVPEDGTLYGEFWFKTGKARQMELGSRRGFKCISGIVQFTLFGPVNVGDGAIIKLADNLNLAFSQMQWQVPPDGYVTIEPMATQPFGVRNGHNVVIVEGAFDFYYRTPEAPA